MMEALVCHPLGTLSFFCSPDALAHVFSLAYSLYLDTIKVRMQLSRRARMPGAKKRGFIATGAEIVKKETPLGLYKGLGAVVTGIVPKMAIRFTSFEQYKILLRNKESGEVSPQATFLGEWVVISCAFYLCICSEVSGVTGLGIVCKISILSWKIIVVLRFDFASFCPRRTSAKISQLVSWPV